MFDVLKGIIQSFLDNPKLIIHILFLAFLGILIDRLYPKFRGFMGEFWLKLKLSKLDKSKYMILNGVLIKDDNGTHQIDHIILSNYGIFVIEMKNYYGLIKGNERDYKWMQYLGKKKYSFKNPIHQNYGHVKSLSNLLNIDDKYFIPIVCFSDQVKLSVNTKSIVIQLNNLKDIIYGFTEFKNEFDVDKMHQIIIGANIQDKTVRKEHVIKIKENININNELEVNMICPKCKGNLIKRTGKYGEFIGCSNYPKCRYIRK